MPQQWCQEATAASGACLSSGVENQQQQCLLYVLDNGCVAFAKHIVEIVFLPYHLVTCQNIQ
jgi:hypothetical protein